MSRWEVRLEVLTVCCVCRAYRHGSPFHIGQAQTIPRSGRMCLWRRMSHQRLLTCWIWKNWGLCSEHPLCYCSLRSFPRRSHGFLTLSEISPSTVVYVGPGAVSWLYLLTTAYYIGRRGVRKCRHLLVLLHVCESRGPGRDIRGMQEGGSRKAAIQAFVDLGPAFFSLCLKHLALCLGAVNAQEMRARPSRN